jgi:hypothetical protein
MTDILHKKQAQVLLLQLHICIEAEHACLLMHEARDTFEGIP